MREASQPKRSLTGALAVVPSEGGDRERLRASLAVARARGLGDFREIVELKGASGGEREVIADAAAEAVRNEADWLFVVSEAETVAADIFVKAAPALRLHDAVWGGAAVAHRAVEARLSPSPQGGGEGAGLLKPEQITRLAAQDLPMLFHAALVWWIGPAHFVGPGAALEALENVSGPAWRADYMMHLWRNARAYKTAQALTVFRGALPELSQPERAHFVEALERKPVFLTVAHAGHTMRLPYTGVNPVIERQQLRGLFFEHDELDFLAARLPRGLRIVDVGANTGNHTAFFAAIMQAERVVPIEPHPRAAAAIRGMAVENALANVDLSRLGVAVGATGGRLRALCSAGGGLGATRFAADPTGETMQTTLDDALADGPVDFIKIDVEGMEMEVLAGASALIARDRPFLFIEVLDATVAEFTAWCDRNAYAFEKLFPDKTHCNYFIVPVERIPGEGR
jgi:FkbM family methyltransferase